MLHVLKQRLIRVEGVQFLAQQGQGLVELARHRLLAGCCVLHHLRHQVNQGNRCLRAEALRLQAGNASDLHRYQL